MEPRILHRAAAPLPQRLGLRLLLGLALGLAGTAPVSAKRRPAGRGKAKPAATAPAEPAAEPSQAEAPSEAPAEEPTPEAPQEDGSGGSSEGATAGGASERASRRSVELEQIQEEYNAIRDELFRSRAKVGLLGEALFKTRMVVDFQYEAQRAWPLQKVSLRIDGKPVYTADSPSPSDPIRLYEGFAAPGRHSLTARVEAIGAGGDRLGYAAETRFDLEIPDGKQTRVRITADETGSGAQALAKKKQGRVEVRLRADVKVLARDAK